MEHITIYKQMDKKNARLIVLLDFSNQAITNVSNAQTQNMETGTNRLGFPKYLLALLPVLLDVLNVLEL
jgi:hypothetical protein